MAHGNKTVPIPVELTPAIKGLPVASTEAIYDYLLERSLEEINRFVSSQDSFNTLKNEPDAYLRNVQYDISNNNVTYVPQFTSITIRANRADQPLPIYLKDLYNNTIYTTPKKLLSIAYFQNGDKIYNLIPGLRYFYFDTDEKLRTFTIRPSRRFLYVDNVKGVRDLGGIPTKVGGHIAYDKIIRGSELDGTTVTATRTALDILKKGITLDLDLRNNQEANYVTSSPLGVKYVRIPFIVFENINTLSEEEKIKIKNAFELVANEVINGGKVYIHCVWGCHRAGFLSTLIEGILGASQYEIDKDYELSSFAPFDDLIVRTDSNYKKGINAINELYNGSWIGFAEACGISSELIDSFKKAMIVETLEEQPDYYEVTYEKLVSLRNNSKLIPGAMYRMIDFDTVDGAESDIASCSGIADLPEFKSAYHHFDLLLTALSANELDSNVKALHSERDTERYFTNQDLSKWELKYDLDNNRKKYTWAVDNDVINVEKIYIDSLGNVSNKLVYYEVYIGDSVIFTIKPSTSPKDYKGEVIYTSSEYSKYLGKQFNIEWDGYIITGINFEGADFRFDTVKYYYNKETFIKHIKGKGVIYYMKDEFNNEVPYDFKNILFKAPDILMSSSHEYVDLGLPSGTLWATCNVGANSPEEFGDYFAWGETESKDEYNWSTYKWCNGSYDTMTKYCTNNGYNGFTDGKTELDPEDDAATANWGSGWRMPSIDQINELINSDYTTTEWTTQGHVSGRLITSKSNGNSIFLPAAGYRFDTSLGSAGSSGHYWSRSLDTFYSGGACYLGFDSGSLYWSYYYRNIGFTVRPVFSSPQFVPTFGDNLGNNNVIKPYLINNKLYLNNNIFYNTTKIDNNFFDYDTHDNLIIGNAINMQVGKYCSNNYFEEVESAIIEYDCVNLNVYNQLIDSHIGKGCFNLKITNNSENLIVEDFVNDKELTTTEAPTIVDNDIEYVHTNGGGI